MKIIVCILISILLFLVSSVSFASTKSIDLGIECNGLTSMHDRYFVENNSTILAKPGQICIEKSNHVDNLNYEKMNLDYNKAADVYVLYMFFPNSDLKSIREFSTKNIHRNLVIIKNGKFLIEAEIEATLDKSIISIGVPDQKSGHLLGNAISGRAKIKK